MTQRMAAAVVGILGFAGSVGLAFAAGETARPFPDRTVPPEIARKRVIGGRPLIVGDLKPASDVDAESLLENASGDRRMLAKCVEIGEGMIQWAAGGTSLELAPPWGYAATTNITTAYCDNGFVFLGGSRQEVEDGQSATWLFYWSRSPGQEYGPVSLLARQSRAYTVTELKAIDPVSRRLLFSGTSPDGRDVLLAARFAILPRR